MSVRIEINNVAYDGFKQITVQRSFDNFASGFSFVSVWSPNKVFPIEVQDKCVIYINNIPVINGFIEKLSVEYDAGSHIITLEGRDKTCDIIDSSANNKVIYNPPITFKKVIQNVLDILGISEMSIIENVSVAPFNKTEVESSSIGDLYFSFLSKLAKLRQVILTTDGNGNIVIDQASKTLINTVLLGKINTPQNNVKKSSSTFDFTRRLHSYSTFSQGSVASFIDVPQTPQQFTLSKGTATDSVVRKTRQANFISEKVADNADLQKRATWEANLRRAYSKVYSCSVQGFNAEKDGFIWRPNLLVKVDDDFAKTSGIFLVKDVTYTLDLPGGEQTDLSLVVKDAFTVQAELDQADARVNVQGRTFVV